MKMTNSDDQLISDFWLKVLNRPETLLEGVRFDWNEMDKVYDIVLEGEFLPIKGPVTLVDYQIQYKYAVEKMVRSVLETGLHQIARVIPEPMTQNIVNLVITDAFEMLETAYQYQMNQLEDTLRSGVTGRLALGVDTAHANKGLNVLYGTRSDLVSAYILAIAQGKEFDWQAMDKMGQTARYNNEKAYNIKRAEMNSQLTLEKGCEMSLLHDYFGVCSLKGNSSKAVYSLISERSVYGYSFGAPLVYRYGYGYEMTLKRAGTWAMSMGLRVFDLPISSVIINQLDGILKNYLYTGMTDEAYLRNALYMQNEPSDMLKWLYIQNLNPFLPKTASFEQWVIDANLKGMH